MSYELILIWSYGAAALCGGVFLGFLIWGLK
jgi:uncharacterized membrane-anchored protein YhcB (DUF1043 family)